MTVPAGWYDDGSGRQRWWDGAQWTEHFAPSEPAAQVAAAAAEASDSTSTASAETDAAAEDFDIDATARREDLPRASAAPEFAAPAAQAYEPPVAPDFAASAAPAAPAYAAPAAGNPAYMAPAYAAPAYAAAPQGPKSTSVLGFVGLGLAVLGTILACIPMLFTVIPGLVVLFAGLVISIISLFKKGAQKRPGITGAALAVVGGIIGGIVLVVMLLVSTVTAISEELPSGFPTPMPSDLSEMMGRPAPEMITAGFLMLVSDQEDIGQYTQPDVAACIGQHLYDSDLTDETLWNIATGTPVDDAVYDDVQQAADAAGDACLTQ